MSLFDGKTYLNNKKSYITSNLILLDHVYHGYKEQYVTLKYSNITCLLWILIITNIVIIISKQNTNYHVNHVTNVSNLCMVSGRREWGTCVCDRNGR